MPISVSFTIMTSPCLLLVDGHNLLWRAAYGFPARVKSRSGVDRTAQFGFFALLRSSVRRLGGPAEVVVCFDGQNGLRRRTSVDPEYKRDREGGDLTPIKALGDIKRGLDLQTLQWVEMDDVECDDLIGGLVRRDHKRRCYILSTDKDYYQLLSADVSVLDTTRRLEEGLVTPEVFERRFSLTPAQWCDYRALTGDASDNVTGVRGVGPRTAARLLAGGMLLEGLLESGRLNGRMGERIRAEWTHVMRNREVLRIQSDLAGSVRLRNSPTPPLWTAPQTLDRLGLWS